MAGTRRKAGRLHEYVSGYRSWLEARGYTASTVCVELKQLGQVGRWLDCKGLAASEFTGEQVTAFLADRRAAGFRRVPSRRGLTPLLTYLRETGAVPTPAARTSPLDELVGRYRSWLVDQRGLAATTVLRYENAARLFLRQQAVSEGRLHPQDLTGADVNAFLLQECGRVSVGAAKGRVAELRSLLRFLYLDGVTPLRLGAAVPPVAGWHDTTVPATLTAGQVRALLDSCDRGTANGIRDRAIIMLLARLGLRSIEIARLELDDVDWRAGDVLIRGKARRNDRLPLPGDVGDALVSYLRVRPVVAGDRHVFITGRAPRGPIRADLVGDVVQRACRRAGLAQVGPHQLRHALAAQLLRHGAGLPAISQVLRHRDLATTAHYAKVDLAALRQVAQPWPGAGQ